MRRHVLIPFRCNVEGVGWWAEEGVDRCPFCLRPVLTVRGINGRKVLACDPSEPPRTSRPVDADPDAFIEPPGFDTVPFDELSFEDKAARMRMVLDMLGV